MQINVSGPKVDVTPALRSYVESKFERIVRHFDHQVEAAWAGHPFLKALGPARLHGRRDLFQGPQHGTESAGRHRFVVFEQIAPKQRHHAAIERR